MSDPTDVSVATRRRQDALLDELEHGNERFEAQDFAGAIDVYERVVASLTCEDDGIAPPIFENLGLAYWFAGEFTAAERALLRALDGVFHSREQSLRFAVLCAFRRKRPYDARERLALYQEHFGAHPSGWTLAFMQEAVDRWRHEHRLASPC